jgi:hypothetical protein
MWCCFIGNSTNASPVVVSAILCLGLPRRVVPEVKPVPKATAKLAAEGVAWYQRTVAKEPTASGDEIYKMFNERVLHQIGRASCRERV